MALPTALFQQASVLWPQNLCGGLPLKASQSLLKQRTPPSTRLTQYLCEPWALWNALPCTAILSMAFTTLFHSRTYDCWLTAIPLEDKL